MAEDIRTYRDLIVWQKSFALANDCYLKTRPFPKAELYGLTSQIRRAATSVPANIAEGHGRENTGAFINHLRIAQGSLKELETHVLLASAVTLLEERPTQELLEACDEVGRLLWALIRSLQAKVNSE